MNKTAQIMLLIATSMLPFTACDDDEEHQPSYITSLVEANTDANGMVSNIRTDDGTVYNIRQSIKAETADTTIRCLATYTTEASAVQLYSLKAVFSMHPKQASQFKSLPHDPMKFISIWRSDRYVNLQVGIMTTGADGHAFGFCEDSITANASGTKTAHISILHQRPEGDAESYTETRFLSIPLSRYAACDSFEISIPTYEGITTYTK